jgi:hypothetical protein
MKRKAWLLLFAAMTVLAVPAHAQREFLCGFTGFDYLAPQGPGGGPAIPTPFLSNGDGYRAVGFVTAFSPVFTGLLSGAEHTFYLSDATVVSSSFINNTLEVFFLPHARFDVYEDPANNAVYGINPPSATSPSSFTDGTLLIGADVNQLSLVYDYDSAQGNFDGTATLDTGSDLSLIPLSRRSGWVMSGQAGFPNATVPAGYVNQIDGQVEIPSVTPAAHKSWGALKALYR